MLPLVKTRNCRKSQQRAFFLQDNNGNVALRRSSNWLALLWPPLIFTGTTLHSFPYILSIILQEFIIFFGYFAATQAFRDRYMAAEIDRHADAFSETCLVIGKKHLEGITTELAEIEGVSVLNPGRKES